MLRLRALFKPRAFEQELDDELRFHFDHQVESYIARGLMPSEAPRRARLEFGRLDQIKEEHRDALSTRLVEDLTRDVGYGARTLVRNPGFTIVILLTLGIGIGASSAIFSVLNAVLTRALPVGDAQRPVYVGVLNPKLADVPVDSQVGIGAFAPSNADFSDLRRAAKSFSSLTIFAQYALNLTGRDFTERIGGARVTGEFFGTLDARPELGRTLMPDDGALGHEHVVVISHRLWQSEFGSNPNALTQRLSLNGQAYEIVGVMPPPFLYPGASDLGPDAASRVTDVWIPMVLTPRQQQEARGAHLDCIPHLHLRSAGAGSRCVPSSRSRHLRPRGFEVHPHLDVRRRLVEDLRDRTKRGHLAQPEPHLVPPGAVLVRLLRRCKNCDKFVGFGVPILTKAFFDDFGSREEA
jgi:hypothetical protein